MAKQSDTTSLFSSLIKQAEDAAAHVKDRQLRGIAFGQILSHLLSTADHQENDEIKTPSRTAKAGAKRDSQGTTKKSGPLAWLRELVDEGFFKKPKNLKDIVAELSSRSHHLKSTGLTSPLETLCHDRALRRTKQSMGEGRGKLWHWVNW